MLSGIFKLILESSVLQQIVPQPQLRGVSLNPKFRSLLVTLSVTNSQPLSKNLLVTYTTVCRTHCENSFA